MKLFFKHWVVAIVIICLGLLMCLWIGGVPMVHMFLAAFMAIVANEVIDTINDTITED